MKQVMKKTDAWIIILLIVTGFTITCGCLSTTPTGDAGKTAAASPADAGVRIITEEFPPFNYAGPDGKATGLATDMVNGILTRLNQKAEIEILPWSEGYSHAVAGPKIALYSTVRTDEREHLFKWVGPIASYDYTLYAKNGSVLTINSLDAVRKAGTIGVVKDDARHQFLLQNRFENILTCDTDAGCLRNLTSGKTDLWLGSSVSLAAVAQKEGIDTSSFKGVYSVRTVPLYIAFSNDTSDSMITGWQDALDAMKRDGTLDTIQRKYGVSTTAKAAVAASAGEQADLALTAMIAETDGRLKIVLRTFEVLVTTPDVKSRDWKQIRPQTRTAPIIRWSTA
jgi:polar amino acid transport system substrate-binding protein